MENSSEEPCRLYLGGELQAFSTLKSLRMHQLKSEATEGSLSHNAGQIIGLKLRRWLCTLSRSCGLQMLAFGAP